MATSLFASPFPDSASRTRGALQLLFLRFSAAFSLLSIIIASLRFFFWVVLLSPVHFPNQGHSGIGLSAWDAEEGGIASSERVV